MCVYNYVSVEVYVTRATVRSICLGNCLYVLHNVSRVYVNIFGGVYVMASLYSFMVFTFPVLALDLLQDFITWLLFFICLFVCF